MTETQVKNNIEYVFAVYQLKKLLEKDLITITEFEKLDKEICKVLDAQYKYSCNMM